MSKPSPSEMRVRAREAIKYAAIAVDMTRPRRRGVTFLLYHRVGGSSGLQIDMPRELFDEQMALLASEQRASTLDDALDLLAEKAFVPSRDPVVVTFDDGTADWLDAVTPILVRYSVPATFYVATDFIEAQRPFPGGGKPISWAGLRDIVSAGVVTIGSHTHTHALLDRLAPGRVEDELSRSTALIEDHVGVTPAHFAYPKALAGSVAAEAVVRRSFRSAALAGTRPNPYGRTDPHRLARSPIQVADGMRWFRRKVNGGMQFEDRARRVLNRRRYANAES